MSVIEGNAVYRIPMERGDLLAVNHDVNGFQVSLHYWVKDGRKIQVNRAAGVGQSLRDAIAHVFVQANCKASVKQTVEYIYSTPWGAQYPGAPGTLG